MKTATSELEELLIDAGGVAAFRPVESYIHQKGRNDVRYYLDTVLWTQSVEFCSSSGGGHPKTKLGASDPAPAVPSGVAKGSTSDCWNNQSERRQAKSSQLRLRQAPGATGVPVWSWALVVRVDDPWTGIDGCLRQRSR